MLDQKFLDHVMSTNNVSKDFYRLSTHKYILNEWSGISIYEHMILYTNNYVSAFKNEYEKIEIDYSSLTNQVRISVYSEGHLEFIENLIEYLKSVSRNEALNLFIAKYSKDIIRTEPIEIYYDSKKESK